MSKICCNKKVDLVKFTDQKKYLRNDQELKLSFKIRIYKKPPISTLPKNLRWSELRSIICKPDLYNLKTRKNLKTYLIVRIELALIENTLKDVKHK